MLVPEDVRDEIQRLTAVSVEEAMKVPRCTPATAAVVVVMAAVAAVAAAAARGWALLCAPFTMIARCDALLALVFAQLGVMQRGGVVVFTAVV